MRYGLRLEGRHKDAALESDMRQTQAWADAIEGDQVGPFDHPAGTAADAPFVVAHELGSVPGSFALEDPGYTGKGVYATAEDRQQWTADTITLRSPDPANRNIMIRVRRRSDA